METVLLTERSKMISEQKTNPIGYIVYESQELNPLSHKETWAWFPRYDEAAALAIEFIKRRTDVYNEDLAQNTVIIYKGTEAEYYGTYDLSHEHKRVVFRWRNY